MKRSARDIRKTRFLSCYFVGNISSLLHCKRERIWACIHYWCTLSTCCDGISTNFTSLSLPSLTGISNEYKVNVFNKTELRYVRRYSYAHVIVESTTEPDIIIVCNLAITISFDFQKARPHLIETEFTNFSLLVLLLTLIVSFRTLAWLTIDYSFLWVDSSSVWRFSMRISVKSCIHEY